MNYGKAIRSAREALRMTIKELSNKSGRQERWLYDVEANAATPSIGDVKDIAKALNTSVELLQVLSIEDADVPKGRKEIADILLETLQKTTLELIKMKDDESNP